MAELSGFDSWKRARPSEGRRGRRTRLAVVGTLGLATVAALFYSLFEPFTAPDLHLFDVHLGEPAAVLPLAASERSPVRYAARDAAAFQQIARRIHRYAPNHAAPRIDTAEKSPDVKSLGRQLLDAAPDSGQVLILYLATTGISLDGEAYLEWPAPEPNAASPRLRVAEVLEQIQRSPARMKLLLLDAGHRDFSVRDSEVVNEFTPLLKTAVENTQDPGLWVLVSHSALETSHVSHRHRRSYFSLAVTDALNGAADRDANGQIDVGELYRFVAANVSENVRRATGHYQSQTPVLCWGGGTATNQKLAQRLLPTLKNNADGGSGEAAKPASLFAAELTAKTAEEWLKSIGSPPAKSAIPSLPPKLAALSPEDGTERTPGTRIGPRFVVTGFSRSNVGSPDEQAARDRLKPVTTNAGAPAPKSAPAAKTEPAKPPASTPGNIAARLAAAWMLRDRLTARTTGAQTPVDFAPHLWRRIETQLLQCERQYRILGPFVAADSEDKSKPPVWPRAGLLLSRELDDVLALMRALGSRQPLDSPPITPLEQDIAAYFAAVMVEGRKDGRTEGPRSASNPQLSTLDRLIDSGSFAQFIAWAMKLSDVQQKSIELRFARRLAEATHVNWDDVRLALTARRYAERIAAVAADEWDWVGREMLEADRLQNAAERQLQDGIGADFRQRFRSILARSVQRYAAVADRLRVLRAGRQTYHDVAFRAADVVRWHHASDFGPAGNGPTTQQVRLLLTTLKDLARSLDTPSSSNLTSVRRLTDVLRSVQTNTADSSNETVRTVVDRLTTGGDPLAGDRLRLQTALRLPFLSGELRLKALQAADRLSQTASDVVRDAGDWHGPDRRTVSQDDREKLLARAELDVLLAEAAVLPTSDLRPPTSDLRAALQALHKESQNGPAADGLWVAHRRLASALRKLRNGLPQELMNAATTAGPGAVLRRGRVLVENPPTAFDANDLMRRRMLQRASQRIGASEQRLRSALNDAPVAETKFLTSTGEQLAAPAAALGIQSPDSVSLVDIASDTVAVRIRNLGTQSQAIRAVVEYDGRLLDVADVAENAVLLPRGTAPASGSRTPGRLTLDSAFDAARDVTLGVAATQELRFTLRRREVATSQPTRLVVHVKAGGSVVRRSTAVDLPSAKSIELLVVRSDRLQPVKRQIARQPSRERPAEAGHYEPARTGPTVGRENGVTALHPFPNRTTEFQFQLQSLRRVDRTVDVQVFVPDRALPNLSPADLTPADFAATRDRMGGLKLLAEQKGVKLPGDGSAVRVNPKAPAGAKPPAAVKLDFGLLFVIRDQRGGRSTVRPVRISVQRPRRFVVPHVSFNAETRRLDIRVAPRNPNWLPAGPVSVQCNVIPRLPDGVDANLGGALTQKSSLNLFAVVPEQLGRSVRLYVHVDGFRRAFVFQVPTDRNVASVPEETSRHAVRLIVDDKARLVSGAAPKVAAKLEVDAPVGSFQKGDDRVDVGVDADRDRKLDGDVFRRLPSDRDASASLEAITDDGKLAIRSSVADWTVDVSLKDYRNRKVNLLARLVTGRGATYSNSVPVLADARPPVIEPLRNLSALEGKPLDLEIAASDEDLAGVEKIEVAVDPGTGQFPKDPPPSVATAGNQGRWVARVATDKLKPGRYRLLIRATDRAGNAGNIVKAPFLVLSKKDLETRNQPKPNRVEGVVVWDGDAIGGATVTLTQQGSKTRAKIPPVTTDKNGEFLFPAVPPGKYVLTAKKAALANKNRTVTLKLTVPLLPETPPTQRVEFP